jgi:hypothetical protein
MTQEEVLQDLQRRYKNMENEKRLFTEEAQTQFKRHKAMIEKLQSDNDAMKEELNIATKEGVLLRNSKTSMTVLAAKS